MRRTVSNMNLRTRSMDNADRENACVKTIKSATKRKALGEISNVMCKEKKLDDPCREGLNEKIKLEDPPKFRAKYKKIADDCAKLVSLPAEIDVDEYYKDNIFLVTNYAKAAYKYMRERERQLVTKKWPLHPSVNQTTRESIVNWLVKAQEKFCLCQETFHLAVSIFDRYLQLNSTDVTCKTIHLLAAGCLSLAIKYEEVFQVGVEDLLFFTFRKFTMAEFYGIEIRILTALKFEIGRPSPIQFLRRYNMVANCGSTQHGFSKYAVDLGLHKVDICHVPPSLLAAGASLLARIVYHNAEISDFTVYWSRGLIMYSNYCIDQVLPVTAKLAAYILAEPSHAANTAAIRSKYSVVGDVFHRCSIPETRAILTCIAHIVPNRYRSPLIK